MIIQSVNILTAANECVDVLNCIKIVRLNDGMSERAARTKRNATAADRVEKSRENDGRVTRTLNDEAQT
jgi:hypothetical protein